MLKKRLGYIVLIIVCLASLALFVAAQFDKTGGFKYTWYMALAGAGIGIGACLLIASIFNHKNFHWALGTLLIVGCGVAFLFEYQVLADMQWLIWVLAIAAVLVSLIIKYLFNVRSVYAGDNEAMGYKNYKQRRHEQRVAAAKAEVDNTEDEIKKREREIEHLKMEREFKEEDLRDTKRNK